jgi:methionine synthase II (cobalamin-independent)
VTGWPAGAATGIGSLPGTDIAEAVKTVFGELPELPHLPELPARGPGADMVGRSAGFLVELPVELYAARWRLTARPGVDLRHTRDLAERDLDTLTGQADGYTGPFKVQAAGPWTLAATVELPGGGRILRDHGAVRDLTESLAEGLAGHVAEVAARVPGAEVMLQLDEPSLPAVLAGAIPTDSGLHRYRAVEAIEAEQALRRVVERVGVPVIVHCCAPDVPVTLLRAAGAVAVSLDLDLLDLEDPAVVDPLGEALDAGAGLFAGVVSTSPPVTAAAQVADRLRTLWRRFGFPPERLPEQVVVTPACGLAGASPEHARTVMTTCRETARRLLDDPGS